jgi:antitoxin ParD1/3/4
VRELIRRDQDRRHLWELLLEGTASASTAPVDANYFEGLRKQVRQQS